MLLPSTYMISCHHDTSRWRHRDPGAWHESLHTCFLRSRGEILLCMNRAGINCADGHINAPLDLDEVLGRTVDVGDDNIDSPLDELLYLWLFG